jgi:cell pole-organizing protein PopZ
MEDILASIRRIISSEYLEKESLAKKDPASSETVSDNVKAEDDVPAKALVDERIKTSIPVESQKPITGSLSAFAEQIRSGGSNFVSPSKDLSPEAKASFPNIAKETAPEISSADKLAIEPIEKQPLADNSAISKAEPVVLESPANEKMSFAALATQVTGRDAKQDVNVKSTLPEAENKEELKSATSQSLAKPVGETSDRLMVKPSGLSLKDLAEKISHAAGDDVAAKKDDSDAVSVLDFAINAAAKTETDIPPADKEKKREKITEEPLAFKEQDGGKSMEAFKEALVAPSTQAAVTNSMDRLRKSVEDIDTAHVENVLRPMLKTWLDNNLPAMVERMVQEEISKITSRK